MAVALACVAGPLTALTATSHGIGLSPDSLQYLSAAESAARGDGLTAFGWDGELTPLTHFPPGYPLALSAGARAGWAPKDFAPWLNAVLFASTILLVAVIACRVEPKSQWVAPAAAWLLAINPDLVVAHSMAWSEPLYLLLTLGSLLALASAIDRRSTMLLALAIAGAAAATLTRYVGVANIVGSAIAVMLWWPASRWRRIARAGVSGVLAVAPLALLLAGGGGGAGDAAIANRQLAWHPLHSADLRLALVVVSKWIDPRHDADYLSAIWFAALGVLVGWVILFRRTHGPGPSAFPPSRRSLTRVLVLYAGAYLTVFILSMLVADAQTGFEPRLVIPILLPTIIIGAVWLARQRQHGSRVRRAVAAILILLLAADFMRIVPWLRDARSDGLALRRLRPDGKSLVDATRRLPPNAHVYSNDPYFLRVHTAHMVAGLPRERDPNSLAPNSRHAQQVQTICERAAARPTVLVLFDTPASPDPTANAGVAGKGAVAERLKGGVMIRVRPRCAL